MIRYDSPRVMKLSCLQDNISFHFLIRNTPEHNTTRLRRSQRFSTRLLRLLFLLLLQRVNLLHQPFFSRRHPLQNQPTPLRESFFIHQQLLHTPFLSLLHLLIEIIHAVIRDAIIYVFSSPRSYDSRRSSSHTSPSESRQKETPSHTASSLFCILLSIVLVNPHTSNGFDDSSFRILSSKNKRPRNASTTDETSFV